MEAKNDENLNQNSQENNESITSTDIVSTEDSAVTEISTENVELLNDEFIIEIETVKKISKKNNKVKMKDKKKTVKANEKEKAKQKAKAKSKKAKKAKKDKAKKAKVKAKIKEKKAKAKSKKAKKNKKK